MLSRFLLKKDASTTYGFVAGFTGETEELNSLKYHPFLIKPNRQEISEMFDAEVKTEEQTANINEIVIAIMENVTSLAEASESTGESIGEVYNVIDGVKKSLEQIIE